MSKILIFHIDMSVVVFVWVEMQPIIYFLQMILRFVFIRILKLNVQMDF